ncbi:MAG: hypothetical protein EA379_01045 [Phycisphaerales bacterium]|nr:MAG: hypothetical protein EA379_01045 [Phycisphaerales bacterium]
MRAAPPTPSTPRCPPRYTGAMNGSGNDGAIVFDDGLADLGPMTDLRPACLVRTGALTTLERIDRTINAPIAGLFVPDALAAITRELIELPVNDAAAALRRAGAGSPEGVLFVSGRCLLPAHDIADLPVGRVIVEEATGHVIAARLNDADARAFIGCWEAPAGATVTRTATPCLAHRPWDVIRLRDATIAHDLALLAHSPTQDLPPGVLSLGEHELTIAPDATVYPTAVLDLEHGPIVIERGAVVRPGAVICGPAYIGPDCRVIDHALVKANTALGPTTRVGGEVGGTIFQGFANKVHEGHLGDSWVGEWANLGAGTTNSNLLNTYSEVIARAAHGRGRERTGLVFYGCVVGDHVKLAIGTRIMTGAVIGTGTMVSRSAPVTDALGAFRWATDEGEKPFRFTKFMEVARASMARRGKEPSAAIEGRLHEIAGASSDRDAT